MRREAARWTLSAAFVTAAHAAVWLTFTRPSAAPESDAGAPIVTLDLSPIVTAPAPPPEDARPDAAANSAPPAAPGAMVAEPAAKPPPPEPPKPEPPKQAVAPPPDAPPPAADQVARSEPPAPPTPARVPDAPPPPPTDLAVIKDPPPEPRPLALPPGAPPTPPPSAPSTASNHVADIAAAPANAPGSEEAVSPALLHRWRQELIAQIERHKRFPAGAEGHAGVVKVAFTIDGSGRLLSVRIASSSGSHVLDGAAIDLIRRAQPFPAPPEGLSASELSFVAPIRYLVARQP